jgi:hypothetical protein
MQMSRFAQYSGAAGLAVSDSCAEPVESPVPGQVGLEVGVSVVVCIGLGALGRVRKCNGSISPSHKQNPRRSLRTYVDSGMARVN